MGNKKSTETNEEYYVPSWTCNYCRRGGQMQIMHIYRDGPTSSYEFPQDITISGLSDDIEDVDVDALAANCADLLAEAAKIFNKTVKDANIPPFDIRHNCVLRFGRQY